MMIRRNLQSYQSYWWRFARYPAGERRLFLEALGWLGLARSTVLLLPFRWIAAFLGEWQGETAETLPASQQAAAWHIGQVIATGSRHTIWRSNCLAQAIAGSAMLRRRGIPYTLYLGARLAAPNLEAHAWLRCGSVYVTGGNGREQFAILFTIAGQGK